MGEAEKIRESLPMIRAMRSVFFALLTLFGTGPVKGQLSQQHMCARQVAADIKATKAQSPDLFATIRRYTFEWSHNYHACVMVIQYNVHDKNRLPEVQILATNIVTHQPMEGLKNIFLVPANDEKQIEDATSFLMDKYAK